MKLLFLCTMNELRSPTAESLFNGRDGHVATSAGCDSYANRVVTEGMLVWADLVFVMEYKHRDQLKKRFPKYLDKVIVLGIKDIYARHEPKLQELLLFRVTPFLD